MFFKKNKQTCHVMVNMTALDFEFFKKKCFEMFLNSYYALNEENGSFLGSNQHFLSFVLRYSLAFILKLYLMTDMTVCKNDCFELWMKIHAMLKMRQMGQVIKPGVNSFFEIVWNLKYSRLFASYIKLDLLCKLSVLNSIGEVLPNTWYQRTRFKQ